MQQSQRLAAILERLSVDGSVGVVDIARELDVSTATVRRDLQLLESQRLLGRTHGGAVPQGVLYELPLRYKSTRQPEEKRRIAREAASRVADGWAIGLTGGTTTTEVARALVDRPHLTVVTNALNIAAEIAVRPNLKLVVTGGVARPESYELVGPIAEASLRGPQPRHGVPGRRRHLAASAPDDPSRDRGRDQPRADRAGRPRHRGRRQLQDRQGGLRPHLRADRRHRADHRRRGRPAQVAALQERGLQVTTV